MADRSLRRDRLCGLLWELAADRRGELRWSLSKLRRIVDEPDRKRILSERESVRFDAEDVEVDLLRLRALAISGLEMATTAALEAAAGSVRGVFLEGLELDGCAEFQSWCTAEREQARRLHAEVLRQLLDRLAGDPEVALDHARELVRIDPDDEAAHAGLIRLLGAAGRRQEAEQQWRLTEQHFTQIGSRPDGLLIKLRHELAQRPAADESSASDLTQAPGREPAEPERKHLTILVAVLEPPDAWSDDLDPEAALQHMDPALEVLRAAVTRFGGTVTSLPGDGLMALFGAPVAHEDHAVRACYAALAMQEGLRDAAGAGLGLRVGLHSGEIVVRDVEGHTEAVGPAVTLARDVGNAMTPGAIGLTAETCRRAEGFIRARPVTEGGGEGPLAEKLFELIDRTAARSRWEARAGLALTRYVGRDLELAQIGRALERADAGEGRVVAIVGEAGLGKSRLAQEFIRSPAARDWTVLRTGAAAHDRNAAYRPVSDLLRAWCEVDGQDSRVRIAEKLQSRIAQLDETVAPLLPALRSLLDLPVEDDDWSKLSPAKRRRQVHEAVKLLLLHLSRDHPLILMFEDLHWVDRETQTVLDGLVEALGTARILLLVTFRPEFRHGWADRSVFSLIRSDPLDAALAGQLLDSLWGDDPSLDDVKARLVERGGGNPLFLEELAHSLAESGRLTGASGQYRLGGAVAALDMPATIREVLNARIDRLTSESKSLLQVAAVIGREVPLALLQPVARLTEEELNEGLAALQTAELVHQSRLPPDAAYRFKHALTHEAAYEGILRDRRRRLHIKLVGTIEDLFPDRLEEQVGRLAHHAFAGGLWAKAVSYLDQAGDQAVARSAYHEASGLYEQALAALERLPDERARAEQGIDVRLKLRVALNTIGRFEAMLDRLLEADALADRISDHRRRAKVNLAKIWAQGLLGDVAGAIESGRRAAASGNVLGVRSTVACADLGIGWAHWQCGEARESVEFLSRHADYLSGELRFETFGSISARSVFCLSNLARNHALLGAFPEALATGTRGCEIAEELGRPFDLAYAYWHFGSALLCRGEVDEAFSYLDQAYEINLANEFDFTAVGAAIDLGHAKLLSGKASDARPLLQRARDTSRRTRHLHNHVWATVYLGLADLSSGATREAMDLGLQGLEMARSYGFRRAEGLALQLLAVAAAKGESPQADSAEQNLVAARGVFEELGLRPDLVKCLRDLASLYQGLGRVEDAADPLDRAEQISAAMETAETRTTAPQGIWGLG